MAYTLYYHPLSSYCWKALIALYEAGLDFEKRVVDLMAAEQRSEFLKLNPLGKFPVLTDSAHERPILESSILIEYLARHEPSAAMLVPEVPLEALPVRARDRFFDLYVMEPMSKVVTDNLRPEGCRDPHGVAESRARLDTAYNIMDSFLQETEWAAGRTFTLADCAAAPSLYYADKIHPIPPALERSRRYLERLSERPSFARVLREAEPYFAMFPG
ncbi:MAG: glutathione S-transferase family protein [Polyangiaceae bacterium]